MHIEHYAVCFCFTRNKHQQLRHWTRLVVLFYNIINYSIFSYSQYDEHYAISLEKQSTCGETYRDILWNIGIFQKYRDFFKYRDTSKHSIFFWRYIDIEFDIIDISIYRVITSAEVTRSGRLFQTQAAATGKARSPTVGSRVRLTISDEDELEQSRWRASTYATWQS